MSNILKWSLKNAIIGLTGFFCAVVVACAFIAPVFAYAKINVVSDFLYDFLHKLCVAHKTNIFMVLGYHIGICARCIGSYISAAITLYSYLHKFKMHKVVYIILGALSITEILLEHYHYISVNDFIRLLSGLCLGAFLGTTLIKILDWLEGKKGW